MTLLTASGNFTALYLVKIRPSIKFNFNTFLYNFFIIFFISRQHRSKIGLRKRRAAEVDDENTYRFRFHQLHHQHNSTSIFRQNKFKPELIDCDKLKPEVAEEADRGDILLFTPFPG